MYYIKITNMTDIDWPPSGVRVVKLYVAIFEPALLWAVTLRKYLVAGNKSPIVWTLSVGWTWFDTSVHSPLASSLYSTIKYKMGQPPSPQASNQTVTAVELTVNNWLTFGLTGTGKKANITYYIICFNNLIVMKNDGQTEVALHKGEQGSALDPVHFKALFSDSLGKGKDPLLNFALDILPCNI